MMTESKAKPKAKGTSRASKPRKSATKSKSPPKAGATGKPASRLIDQRIRDLRGWRGETLARMRALILEADPEMIEERKWRKPSNAMAGVPVWSHHGKVSTGEAYTKVVKLTFARGAFQAGIEEARCVGDAGRLERVRVDRVPFADVDRPSRVGW